MEKNLNTILDEHEKLENINGEFLKEFCESEDDFFDVYCGKHLYEVSKEGEGAYSDLADIRLHIEVYPSTEQEKEEYDFSELVSAYEFSTDESVEPDDYGYGGYVSYEKIAESIIRCIQETEEELKEYGWEEIFE